MLIFDRFQSRPQAEAFAGFVRGTHRLWARVCDDQQESNQIDPFPFRLRGFIVLVERTEYELERRIEYEVERHGGHFAGT